MIYKLLIFCINYKIYKNILLFWYTLLLFLKMYYSFFFKPLGGATALSKLSLLQMTFHEEAKTDLFSQNAFHFLFPSAAWERKCPYESYCSDVQNNPFISTPSKTFEFKYHIDVFTYVVFSILSEYDLSPKMKSYNVVLWDRWAPVFCHFLVSDKDSVFTWV